MTNALQAVGFPLSQTFLLPPTIICKKQNAVPLRVAICIGVVHPSFTRVFYHCRHIVAPLQMRSGQELSCNSPLSEESDPVGLLGTGLVL